MIRYEELIGQARSFDFINDDNTADSVVKATFGIMVSRMANEEDAREFIRFLPDPLDYEELRSHQVRPTHVDPDQYLEVISRQFHLNREQSEHVVRSLLHKVKESLSEDDIESWKNKLPGQWNNFIAEA